MSADTAALLACPFCGSTDAVRLDDGDSWDFLPGGEPLTWAVVCDYNRGGCGGSGGFRDSQKDAIAAWNQAADRLAELEAENGRLKPAEQHDPLAVSDHCPECSEPEPECVCGEQPDERESLPLMARDTCTNCGGTGVGGYHVHAPQEDAVEALRCEACDGFGFIEHGPKDCPATAPELPLMARREWRESVAFATVNQGAITGVFDRYDAAARSATHHRACIYRIADTDEHGLPVIERTADMPEDVTHMTLHTRRFFRAGELRARSVEGDEGLLRIEDYRESGQEGKE